jgi:cell shape-determining protein MreD
MKHRDYRWLIVLGCNLLLWWLCGLANHYLAPHAIYLYSGGLFVTFAALRLDLRHGFAATLLTGLAIDAMEPVPFGLSAFLFGLVHAFLLYGRQRFPREESVFATVVALLSNLFIFLVLSFVLVGENPQPAGAWLRLFCDLIMSQLVITLITPWFMALQERAFELARIHPETGRPVST